YDIFGILAVGGTIVIPTMDALKDPASWLDLIVTHKITLWNSVPALMQMLVEYLSVQPKLELLPLRLALLSGDWLPVGLPGRISEFCLSIKVVSLGGATEASIWSICYPIEEVNPNCSSIPYGKPLTNQRFYILNELMEPCPIWVPGQLYIGGIGLALGYWQDQEKTNASFITHPVTGERLYQTGDLGRYLPNGNIEFLGRADFQVKINGYRIELGEVEATLKQHAAIQNAVVNAVGESNNKQLVGYVTMDQEITSRSNSAEAYQPSQLEGVVQDPIERIEFKLKQSGLQQIEASQTSIQLPQSDENSIDTYLKRQSYRQFLSQPISLSQFSQFLSCLQQMQLEDYPLPKYLYPSAGSLYPVQTYLLVKPNGVAGLEAGIYYYHPSHRLVLVSANSEIDGSIYQGNKIIFDNGAFSLFLIAELNAIRPMYGELAENFCLLEAGHIGQLLMQSAPLKEIGLCPIGYLELSAIKDLLKLQSSQILLYSFVGGKIDLAQTKQWLSEQRENKSQAIDVQLKHHVKQKLPDYMVPNTFIILDKITLTANGKVDRKMLPLPKIKEAKSEFLTAPRTEIEQTIAKIVQQLLEREAVDVELNFFELGMDSLKLVQLRNKLQTQLEVNISMRQLLSEATNIAELAIAVVEQLKLVKIKQKTLNTELDDEGEIEIIEI
ncbi:MAG: AMP-binding protein, partial [Cyanobacteria bacterium P01_A01_bin.83]